MMLVNPEPGWLWERIAASSERNAMIGKIWRPWIPGQIDLAIALCLLLPILTSSRYQYQPFNFWDVLVVTELAFGFGLALGAVRYCQHGLRFVSMLIATVYAALIGILSYNSWQTILFIRAAGVPLYD
jgi:hypothetical protein